MALAVARSLSHELCHISIQLKQKKPLTVLNLHSPNSKTLSH